MLSNNLVVAFRNFFRYPVFTFINISGLVLGLTSSIFIYLWVMDEFSFNTYHQENGRVYKVMETEFFTDGTVETDHWTPGILAETLTSDFPEVEQAARMAWSEAKLFRVDAKSNYEYGNYADPSIFEVLNMTLIAGDVRNPLPDNNSIAISSVMAARYFGDTHGIGSNITLNNNEFVTVTAIYEALPQNSSFELDFILPFEVYIKEAEINIHKWDNEGWLITFAKLKFNEMQLPVNAKIKNLITTFNPDFKAELFLFSMEDWRLYSSFENGKQSGGRITYVISFSLVALFILAIACINFMNLSTARAATRSKEVGVRKVAGASRGILMRQFMSESILLSFLSVFVSLALVYSLLPFFNEVSGKQLVLDFQNPVFIGGIAFIALATGFAAGIYPSYFLSSFRPVSVLKGLGSGDFKGTSLRKVLVVFQFGLSILIIVFALAINDQISYLRNKDLGFDRERLIYLDTNPDIVQQYESFRNELIQHPIITAVAMGGANPMEINGSIALEWSGRLDDDNTTFNIANCDYDYLNTMGFTLVAGRNFSPDYGADSINLIVSEGVVKKIGWTDPIGQSIRWDGRVGQVIGVIKDFHNLGIKEEFNPTVLFLGKGEELGRWANIFIRYEEGATEEALAIVRDVYKKYNPNSPIQWNFLDENFEYQFRSEVTVGKLSKWFTGMAIIISCLGLFGLTLFETERRRKEIGIRKVLGASTHKLAILLGKNFIFLILYAILIAGPVAFYIAKQFLNEYAYHTPLEAWKLIFPAFAMLLVPLLIIAYQTIKIGHVNPVETMRCE